MSTNKRNCIDCRFYEKSFLGSGRCKEIDGYISIERDPQFDSISRCGSKGLLWEERKSLYKSFKKCLFTMKRRCVIFLKKEIPNVRFFE
jgi:hypothetical protein